MIQFIPFAKINPSNPQAELIKKEFDIAELE
jgi:hypothetical protein